MWRRGHERLRGHFGQLDAMTTGEPVVGRYREDEWFVAQQLPADGLAQTGAGAGQDQVHLTVVEQFRDRIGVSLAQDELGPGFCRPEGPDQIGQEPRPR
jgi:hypothetical protein